MNDRNLKKVSVIIPVRNEEKNIGICIESIINQDYPNNQLEIIFIDGNSEDETKKLINKYVKKYPNYIYLFDNPRKIVPCAMNIGIKKSTGDYIIRLDAHSKYPNNYITECINTMENIEADNVGGLVKTLGKGVVGNAFAKVLSTKFGVGNSAFRTNAKSGYVDTVPFGAYKKDTFIKYGYYDERLKRNQDYELNYRIRKNGGRIYLNSNISLTYFCRNSFSSIASQSYENGKWNIITSKLCPGSMSIRHFVPFVFVLSLILLPLFGLFNSFFYLLLLFELILYFSISIIIAMRDSKSLSEFFTIILLFSLLHLSYGFGTFMGCINLKNIGRGRNL